MSKHAWGICDRSGFRYKLTDLVYEVQNGKRTGMRVGRDMLDPDHPQNFTGRVVTTDPRPLHDPRPDTARAAANALWGWNPVWNPAQELHTAVGQVRVESEGTP